MFSNSEKRDMLRIYYVSHRNSRISSERYLNEFPERLQPHENFFAKLDRNLSEFGSFSKPRNKYGRRIDPNEEENILNVVCFSPLKLLYEFFCTPNFILRLITLLEALQDITEMSYEYLECEYGEH